MQASIYIHIPFCTPVRCDYCDFYSVVAHNNETLIDEYLKALIQDIKYQINYFNVEHIPTVYIGGGTPSVLGEKRIEFLFSLLKSIPAFKPKEFTIEVNPESLTAAFLQICKAGGVNRISCGIQSFYEPSRMAVNRAGSITLLENKLALINDYFPGSLSVDLITGLPFQNEKILLNDIEKLLVFNPVHVSLYSLSLEENTRLFSNIKKRKISLPDYESADNLWLTGRDALKGAGFTHYEVSNFARNGSLCSHNLRYWNMENYLGAGASSCGTLIDDSLSTAVRYTYPRDVKRYKDEPVIHCALREDIDKPALLKEFLLMGYRKTEGPKRERFFSLFGCNIEDAIPKTLERWQNKDKFLFLNSFLTDAFTELEE